MQKGYFEKRLGNLFKVEVFAHIGCVDTFDPP